MDFHHNRASYSSSLMAIQILSSSPSSFFKPQISQSNIMQYTRIQMLSHLQT